MFKISCDEKASLNIFYMHGFIFYRFILIANQSHRTENSTYANDLLSLARPPTTHE